MDSEGKSIPNDLFNVSEGDAEDGSPSQLGVRLSLSGRLGSHARSTIELASNVPDEEEAIARVAQRFRRANKFGNMRVMTPSLDSQQVEGGDAHQIEGFVLDALAERSEGSYVLEEVVDETSRIDAPDAKLRARSGDTDRTQQKVCPHCSALNGPSMRFCVQCGGSLQTVVKRPHIGPGARKPPPPSEAAKQANPWEIYLISINEDGSDGTVIQLEFLETTVGRDGDTRFPTDAFLSPQHARLHIEKGRLFIEDLYSLNGTFLKLGDEVKLTPGDTFLMGRQVLRFERFEQSISPKTKSGDGTRYMGSPAPGGSYKILQIGIGGIIQNVYCLPETGAVLGREKGDIIFPHDKFMSSRHAQIYTGNDGGSYLVDLTSSNGTWIKLWEKTRLRHNDYIFMGQQLFRIHVKDQRN